MKDYCLETGANETKAKLVKPANFAQIKEFTKLQSNQTRLYH